MLTNPEQMSANAFPGMVGAALEYMIDAGQRSVLFLDVMRQRGEQYREHVAESAPHVLNFSVELLVDGRTLNEPVNYALVAIVRSAGWTRPRHRRLQGGQRNRGDHAGRASLLFHRISARPDARADHRKDRASGGAFH